MSTTINFQCNDIVLAEEFYLDENTDEEVSVWHPLRLTDISPNKLLVLENDNLEYVGDWLDGCCSESISDIKPMPITEDFLKINFKQRGDTNVYHCERCEFEFWVSSFDAHTSVTYTIRSLDKATIVLRYFCVNVHELQHALRLCGLSKIANTLKVE